jgi:DNA-binding CsgD family transcriptional regulator
MSNQQIVDRLGISPETVRNHISDIFSKLQVRARAEAVVRGREAGLGGEHRRS